MARNRQSTDAGKVRAEAVFKKKELQLRDGEKARAEYDAQGQATRDRTPHLRAQRLGQQTQNLGKNRNVQPLRGGTRCPYMQQCSSAPGY
jgi:hypothetical protein